MVDLPLSLYIRRVIFKQDFLEEILSVGVVIWLSVHPSICISLCTTTVAVFYILHFYDY